MIQNEIYQGSEWRTNVSIEQMPSDQDFWFPVPDRSEPGDMRWHTLLFTLLFLCVAGSGVFAVLKQPLWSCLILAMDCSGYTAPARLVQDTVTEKVCEIQRARECTSERDSECVHEWEREKGWETECVTKRYEWVTVYVLDREGGRVWEIKAEKMSVWEKMRRGECVCERETERVCWCERGHVRGAGIVCVRERETKSEC